MPRSYESHVTPKELTQWVRVALTHLYDTAFLQTHPLGSALDADLAEQTLDGVSRAQKLRGVLLGCIESLRPQSKGHVRSDAARAYTILSARYVDGLSMEEIAAELGLSVRQIYREHERGLEAVASLFAEKHGWPMLSERDPLNTLKLAQVEANRLKQAIHLEVIDVKEVIEDIVAMLAPLNERLRFLVRADVTAPAQPITAVADRVLLRQALINVLSHASEIAKAEICIDVERTADSVQVSVRTSCASDILSDADEVTPSCIELAIAQSLVEAQGGRLNCAPIHETSEWRAEAHLPIAVQRRTVLVIDDNADLVELFRRYLGGHQLNVVGIMDSAQAIRIATELQPQLITVDVMMPSLDGWDVLRRLKTTPETQHIPVIVCSVLNEGKLATGMGASGYLAKPVKKADLLAMAHQWLGKLTPVR